MFLEEGLTQGHLVYFISDTVDALDLSAFHARYANGGPRKLARKLHEDLAFWVLGAVNFPAHRHAE